MITYDEATLLIYTNSQKLCESLSNELLSLSLSLSFVLRVSSLFVAYSFRLYHRLSTEI